MQFLRYYNTVRFLRLEQVFFQVCYRLCSIMRRLLGLKHSYGHYRKGFPVALAPLPARPATMDSSKTVTFLNISHKFCGVWDERSHGDLWRYNLNYMDFLMQSSLTVEEGCAMIESFIDTAHTNGIADDPYPISLRGINWIKFVSLHKSVLGEEFLHKTDTFLYSQYRILSRRTERHLLANHYLENAFSLLFAALYFRDLGFWKRASCIISSQLPEQVLPDGAHFELSPMYHCIILERLLDCYNLLHSNAAVAFTGAEVLRVLMLDKARAMLSWLDAVAVGDTIPLLNDSAVNVALPTQALRDYAIRLGITWDKGCLVESGYRHVKKERYEAIIDMAPIGVSYNTGHSHADTGTFLLWCGGAPLIVDTGTATYTAGERRSYERSTMAHNTVVVNGTSSSEVWGAFRCARRATPVIFSDGPECYSFSHDGYSARGICCTRGFCCKEDSLEITDTVECSTQAECMAYFHLSPGTSVAGVTQGLVLTSKALFSFAGFTSVYVEDVHVACEYNTLLPSKRICVAFKGNLKTTVSEFKVE